MTEEGQEKLEQGEQVTTEGEKKPEQVEQVVAQLEQERVPTEGEEKEEKKQRFFQTVKCPMCGTDISFEWEAVNVVSIPENEVESAPNEEADGEVAHV